MTSERVNLLWHRAIDESGDMFARRERFAALVAAEIAEDCSAMAEERAEAAREDAQAAEDGEEFYEGARYRFARLELRNLADAIRAKYPPERKTE